MASKGVLRGLGMPTLLARLVGSTSAAFTASGSTQASAPTLGPDAYTTYVNASATGGGVMLPNVGCGEASPPTCDVTDDFSVLNMLSASIIVYTNTANAGSTFIGAGAVTTGSTGVSVSANKTGVFYAITASTWGYFMS